VSSRFGAVFENIMRTTKPILTPEQIQLMDQLATKFEHILANAKRVDAPPETEQHLALVAAISATAKAFTLYDPKRILTDHVKNKMEEAYAALGEANAYMLFGPPGYRRPDEEDDDF
jgi:hypothetical protein